MKFNWGNGIAITYVVFALLMIGLVIKASQQNNDLVTTDYYDKAVNYQQQIDANNRGRNQQISIHNNLNRNQIEIIYPEEFELTRGNITFYKPDNASLDFNVEMKPNSTNVQQLATSKMANGKWKIKLSWTHNNQAYYKEESIFVNND